MKQSDRASLTPRRAAALLAVGFLCAGPVSQAGADPTPAPPEASAGHTVVVELFTSQGCSTCPPADQLLTRLGAESAGRVVPLAFHVDYWNRIGWLDPFSSHDWSLRQTAYARARGLQQVYTPQAIVDGMTEIVGSEEEKLRAAITAAAAKPGAQISLQVEPKSSGFRATAEVDLPESLRGAKLDLMMAVFETGLVTSVGKGENEGRTLHDDYVVRILRRVDGVSGTGRSRHSSTLSLEKDWNRSRLGVVAFVQDPASLEIRGAAALPLSGVADKAPAGSAAGGL